MRPSANFNPARNMAILLFGLYLAGYKAALGKSQRRLKA
jgi:hypothetical protein